MSRLIDAQIDIARRHGALRSKKSANYAEDEIEEVDEEEEDGDDLEDNGNFEEMVASTATSSDLKAREKPSVSTKRKPILDKGNPLNRFGFARLTDREKHETNESSRHTDAVNGQSPENDDYGSARSSVRIAKIIKNNDADVKSSTEKENKPIELKEKKPQREVTRRSSRSSRVVEAIDHEDDDKEDIDDDEEENTDEDGEVEFEVEDKGRSSTVRKSSRTTTVSAGYVEAHSDDEFARSSFIGRERAPRGRVATKPSKSMKKKEENFESESGEDEGQIEKCIDGDSKSESAHSSSADKKEVGTPNFSGSDSDSNSVDDALADADDIDYKIQHILARQSMTPTKWQAVCGPMNTRYANNFTERPFLYLNVRLYHLRCSQSLFQFLQIANNSTPDVQKIWLFYSY